MENAAEALKLAGWVLIFILALSISMNSLSQARQSVDELIKLSDREYITTYIDGSSVSGVTRRKVGAATIVPSIYRAYKENFKIRIEYDSSVTTGKPLYSMRTVRYDSTGHTTREAPMEIYEIDLKDQNLGGESIKEYFIKRILYGIKAYDSDLENKLNTYILSCERDTSVSSNDFFNSDDGLYGFLNSNTGSAIWAEEQLGVYYQEEIESTSTLVSNANKTEKRVVTYILHKGT